MIAVIQRVIQTSMTVKSQGIANIGHWLLVLVGIVKGDTNSDVRFMVEKFPQLRIFGDTQGNMNQSLLYSHGELFLVSQFTLLAKTPKGRRPSFEDAAPPEEARSLYRLLLEEFYDLGLAIPGGSFGPAMTVSLENDGPVTLSLESRSKEKREKG